MILEINFPHVSKKLTLLWGTAECSKYLNELIYDSCRAGRRGFPIECADEIMLLHNVHGEVFPVLCDMWTTGSFRHI